MTAYKSPWELIYAWERGQLTESQMLKEAANSLDCMGITNFKKMLIEAKKKKLKGKK